MTLEGRRARSAQREAAVCVCGSEWFTLRGRPTDPDVLANGAVTMNATGKVTGYAGEPACIECGEPWSPRGGWNFV